MTAKIMLEEIAAALKLPPHVERVAFVGEDRLPSCFPVSEIAGAAIASAGLSAVNLLSIYGDAPHVLVDLCRASMWFGFSIRQQGWRLPSAWDPIAGDYRTREGWIKLHTNAPHHKAAACRVLQSDEDRDAVAAAVARWSGPDLEAEIVAAGGCAAVLRSEKEWRAHPQGAAVASEPLIRWDAAADPQPSKWEPTPGRPLAGLRVLDLTRVLAGPIATRFLAGLGAEVLRIDPPGWEEPGVVPEVTLGKRCARHDLKTVRDRNTLERLMSAADILIHGYRADALDRLGLDHKRRQSIRPGLIDVSLNAYGHEGPWALRRGFDSLVQFSCGIAATGMAWRSSAAPVSLPVQALDQATGYLMAAASIRGVAARRRGEPCLRARLSLARTARLLCVHRGHVTSADFPVEQEQDISADIEATPWGSARRVKAPLSIETCDLRWDRPAAALGSDQAEWF